MGGARVVSDHIDDFVLSLVKVVNVTEHPVIEIDRIATLDGPKTVRFTALHHSVNKPLVLIPVIKSL